MHRVPVLTCDTMPAQHSESPESVAGLGPRHSDRLLGELNGRALK
jgi:hypothetical protein